MTTKGWKKQSPKTTFQRQLLHQQCGSSCFLSPKNLKFPICSMSSCKINQKGLRAAYMRAMQYHYYNIAQKALSKFQPKNVNKFRQISS